MLGQQRRVGGSFDWGRLRYTMDEGSAKAVRVAFERLYRDGLAYRTEALVNWCPGCLTSVSDLEVVATPETGTIWTIRYHLIDEATGSPDPDATISIATTRPETLLGDTAVAVRPDDPRYARARRAPGAHPVRRPRRADHRRRDGRRGLRDGRGQDHAGPRPRRPRDRPAARPALDHDPRRRRVDRRDRHRLRRARPVRGAETDRRGPRRAWATSSAARRTRWSSAAASAARTSSSRASRPSGSSGRARWRPAPSTPRGPAGRASCRRGSRRPGSTG